MQTDKKEDMQEKLIIYQLLQKQLDIFREQSLQLEKTFLETETTKQIIEDLKKLRAENDIIIPIGSGYYIEGKITNVKKVLMSPGGDIMLDKDVEFTDKNLEDKRKDIERISEDLQKKINEVVQRINKLAPELEKMIKEMQKK